MDISTKLVDPQAAAAAPPSLELDALLDIWRAARQDSQVAYEAWRTGEVEARQMSYAVFLAAADREAAAERDVLRAVDHRAR